MTCCHLAPQQSLRRGKNRVQIASASADAPECNMRHHLVRSRITFPGLVSDGRQPSGEPGQNCNRFPSNIVLLARNHRKSGGQSLQSRADVVLVEVDVDQTEGILIRKRSFECFLKITFGKDFEAPA